MALTSALKSNLKKNNNDAATETKKKSLHWAADVVDNAPSKKAKVAVGSVDDSNNNNNIYKTKEEANVGGSLLSNKKKNKTQNDDDDGGGGGEKKIKATPLCSFCGKNPSSIKMKASWRGKDQKQSLCLLHYYTTSAVHADDHHVKILDATLLEAQLNGNNDNNHKSRSSNKNNDTIHKNNKLNVQDLFSEAYVQLQQELAQESLSISIDTNKQNSSSSSSKQNTKKKKNSIINDPLAIIHDLNRNNKKRKAPPPPSPQAVTNNNRAQGGFLKPVTVPERLRKTQQQQAKWQAEQLARMNRVAKTAAAAAAADTSKRREPTRKSIWSTVIDAGGSGVGGGNNNSNNNNRKKKRPSYNYIIEEIDLTIDDVTCSSCGSDSVADVGNITSRNADVRKGEIWGSGERSDEVVMRYRCNHCGKAWQETT